MTTGSRGYHVVVPIKQTQTFTMVKKFAKQLAAQLVEKYPDLFTIELPKNKRKGKIFVDYLRNSYGATSVAPYSIRAHPGAPIATPLTWAELVKTEPQSYTLTNIGRRLAAKKEPWAGFEKAAKVLKP